MTSCGTLTCTLCFSSWNSKFYNSIPDGHLVYFKINNMSQINDKVNKLLTKIAKHTDLTNEVQTEIDPSVNFRRNSINILIGKRGSGKTYNVLKEILKLKYVKAHRYTKLVYVTDKPFDGTYERVKDEIPISVEFVPYEDAVPKIRQIADAKAALKEMLDKKIPPSMLQDEAKAMLEDIVGEELDKVKEVYHTAVLLDDSQNLFSARNQQNKDLLKLLFQNRQPNLSFFLTQQDALGLPTSLKENADSVWVFGGYSKQKFGNIARSVPHDEDFDALWSRYKTLSPREALIFYNYWDKSYTSILNN